MAAAIGGLVLGASEGTSLAGGKEPPPTTDRIIYAQGSALYSIASTGGEGSLLTTLPTPASEVAKIRVAASGTAMLVSYSGIHAWADLSKRDQQAVLRPLPCAAGSQAQISGSGDQVLCPAQVGGRIAVYRMREKQSVRIIDLEAQGPVFFLGDAELPIRGLGDSIVNLETEAQLSPHKPDRHMATAPTGKRAIGGFTEGEIDVVYSFKLDGKGIKRTLMQAARPVTISADSKWASLQQEVDACAVRISGGQYMCWRRYEALDISSHAHSMLLSRAGETQGHDLFIGSVSGTSARKPTPLVQEVERAAAFWRDPAELSAKPSEADSDEVEASTSEQQSADAPEAPSKP